MFLILIFNLHPNRFVMLQKFLNDAKKYYEAGLEEVDFQMKSEAARVNINKWVEKNTQSENQHFLL